MLDEIEKDVKAGFSTAQDNQINSALGYKDWSALINKENESFSVHLDQENDNLVLQLLSIPFLDQTLKLIDHTTLGKRKL